MGNYTPVLAFEQVLDTFPTITWSAPSNRRQRVSDAVQDPARIEEEIETKESAIPRRGGDWASDAAPQELQYDSEKASQLGPRSPSLPASSHAEEQAEGDVPLDTAAPAMEDLEAHRLRLAASILSIRLAASSSVDAAQPCEGQTGSDCTREMQLQDGKDATHPMQPDQPEEQDDGNDYEEEMLCPICVESFEEGDLLRILPCAGRHHYHATCIDVWLLSHSVCPLCRTDFLQRPDARAEEETEQVDIRESLEGVQAGPTEERNILASASASAIEGQVEAIVESGERAADTREGSSGPPSSPVPRSGLFAVTLEEYRMRRRAMRARRNVTPVIDRFRLHRGTRRRSTEAQEARQVIDTIMALGGGDGQSPVPRERVASSTSRPSSSSGRVTGIFTAARRDAGQRSRRVSLPIVPAPVM